MGEAAPFPPSKVGAVVAVPPAPQGVGGNMLNALKDNIFKRIGYIAEIALALY